MDLFFAICDLYVTVMDWFWNDDCFKIYSY